MWVIIGLLIVLVFFSFLAPVFMKIGINIPARTIYKLYNTFCHQLAFRSYYLFGQQSIYPRKLSGIATTIYYEDIITGDLDLQQAREFIGNEELGYKLALCQRDIAIYTSLLLIALWFQIIKRNIKPIPWSIWLVLGLIPIGLDGISQFGGLGINLFSFLPVRESSPVLRTITGALFGVCTGLFMFPMIEETMLITNKPKRSIID